MSLKIKLLGVPKVEARGNIFTPRPRKPFYLLLYAAYRGDWLEREKLSYLFWPEASDVAGQQNLRGLIHRAKAYAFAKNLEVEKSRLRWAVKVDVHDFKKAVANQDWLRAVELYQGKFLESVNPKNGAGFEAWLEQERADLERVWRSAVHKHVEDLEAEGRYAEATPLLYRLLKSEPLAEDVLQRYLKNAYLTGDRKGALSAFESFEKLLKKELELEPLDETLELVKTIEDAKDIEVAFADKKENRQLIPITVLRPPLLIGREEAIDRVQRATTPAIFIVGEAGIGKSRLMAELAPSALHISCQEGLQNVPYYPVIRLIRALVSEGVQTPDLKHYSDDLARLVPEAAPHITPGPADPETGRSRLFEALSLYLEHVTKEKEAKPIALLADDLQWADAPTLNFLAYLASRKTLKLLGAYRLHEQTDKLKSFVQGLGSGQLLTEIGLEPLSIETIQDFLASLIGIDAGPPVFSKWLAKNTGGNPIFMLETLKSLFEAGTLQATQTDWKTAIDDITEDYSELQIPEVVQEVILRRVENLKPETQRVLQVASVISKDFTPQLIGQISGLSEWAVMDGLEEAENRTFIQKDYFAHDLLRQAIYGQLSIGKRTILHRKIAEALQSSGDLTIIAEHWFHGNSLDKAVACWLNLGKDLISRGLEEQAELPLTNVLTYTANSLERQTATLLLAEVKMAMGQHDLALSNLQLLLPQIEDLHLQAYALIQLTNIFLLQGQITSANETLSKVSNILPSITDAQIIERYHFSLIKNSHAQGELLKAIELATEQIKRLRERHRSIDFATALNNFGVYLNELERYDEARANLAEALSIAEEKGSNYLYLFAISNMLQSYVEGNPPEQLLQRAEDALDLGYYEASDYLRHHLARIYLVQKKYKKAMILSQQLFLESKNQPVRAICCARLITLYKRFRKPLQAREMLKCALDLVLTVQTPLARAHLLMTIKHFGSQEQIQRMAEEIRSLDLSNLSRYQQRILEQAIAENLSR